MPHEWTPVPIREPGNITLNPEQPVLSAPRANLHDTNHSVLDICPREDPHHWDPVIGPLPFYSTKEPTNKTKARVKKLIDSFNKEALC
jgi:hypothetical protein